MHRESSCGPRLEKSIPRAGSDPTRSGYAGRLSPANAEQALRHAVLWRKLSGGTASEWGSRFVEQVPSVVATCRRQTRNVLNYFTCCFEAEWRALAIPSPLRIAVAGTQAASS
jgi:hypothetical protein